MEELIPRPRKSESIDYISNYYAIMILESELAAGFIHGRMSNAILKKWDHVDI